MMCSKCRSPSQHHLSTLSGGTTTSRLVEFDAASTVHQPFGAMGEGRARGKVACGREGCNRWEWGLLTIGRNPAKAANLCFFYDCPSSHVKKTRHVSTHGGIKGTKGLTWYQDIWIILGKGDIGNSLDRGRGLLGNDIKGGEKPKGRSNKKMHCY